MDTIPPCGSRQVRALSENIGRQPLQQECVWSTALNNATPLLPDDWLIGVLGQVLEVSVLEGRLVCLHVNPILAVPEDNALLPLLDPSLAKIDEAVTHILDDFVVQMQDAVDGRMRDAIEQQEEQGRLRLQRRAA